MQLCSVIALSCGSGGMDEMETRRREEHFHLVSSHSAKQQLIPFFQVRAIRSVCPMLSANIVASRKKIRRRTCAVPPGPAGGTVAFVLFPPLPQSSGNR